MAQFRSTADVLDLALINSGEVTNGNSSYETQALDFMNKMHHVLISGGTIPLGKDTTVEIDESWPWAKSPSPIVLELLPKQDTGTITLTNGSEVGTFSSAPSISLAGWHLRVNGREEVYRIAAHTASSTAFELDGAYADDTGSGLNFEAMKLDYDVIPAYLTIDSDNQYFQFQKASGTTLTATLTKGVYTPSELATHTASVVTTAASGPTITGSYSSLTRKFSLVSNLAGATSFFIVGNGSLSQYSAHKMLGYDDVTSSNAATQTTTYILGGISRLIEPIKVHKGGGDGSIYGVDTEAFQRAYPLNSVVEGIPDRFCVLSEGPEGQLKVRFNKFPEEDTRVEVEHVAVPHDLKDDSTSIPLVPRKHLDVLEYATSFFLCFLKSDDRMMTWAELAKGKLKAMIAQHRGSLVRSGENFGQIVSRKDQIKRRKSLFPQDPY